MRFSPSHSSGVNVISGDPSLPPPPYLLTSPSSLPLPPQLHLKKVEKVRKAARKLREVGENFIRSTYDKIRAGDPLPDAMFSYVLQEIHEAGWYP